MSGASYYGIAAPLHIYENLPPSFSRPDRLTDTQTDTAANLHYAREQSRVRVEFSDITQTD
jgi:hypothetical protein